MKATYLLVVLCILTLGSLSGKGTSADDSNIIDPSWIKPDPWSRHEYQQRKKQEDRKECQCPPVRDCQAEQTTTTTTTTTEAHRADENNLLAMVFYKKFVTRLFAENQLERDEGSNFLLRNLQFKISQQQLKDLKEAKNAREIDGLVASILEQSKGSIYHSTAETFCWSIALLYGNVTKSTFFIYFFVPTIGLLVAWFTVRGISRIMHVHPGIVVFLMFIMISYVLTFMECQEKLEIQSMAKLKGSNPCEKLGGKRGYLGFMARLFGEDLETKCRIHLRETLGVTLNTCDPSSVLIEMVAKLQLQYFQTFVTKMIETFKISTASSGIIETLLIGIFILGLIYLLVTNVLKYGIHGSVNFLSAYATGTRENPAIQQQQQQPPLPLVMPSFNLNIKLGREGKKQSRVETNRIEEIAEGDKAKQSKLPALKQSGESSKKGDDGGSGDAPKEREPIKIDPASETDSDSEDIEIECQMPTVGTEEAGTKRRFQ